MSLKNLNNYTTNDDGENDDDSSTRSMNRNGRRNVSNNNSNTVNGNYTRSSGSRSNRGYIESGNKNSRSVNLFQTGKNEDGRTVTTTASTTRGGGKRKSNQERRKSGYSSSGRSQSIPDIMGGSSRFRQVKLDFTSIPVGTGIIQSQAEDEPSFNESQQQQQPPQDTVNSRYQHSQPQVTLSKGLSSSFVNGKTPTPVIDSFPQQVQLLRHTQAQPPSNQQQQYLPSGGSNQTRQQSYPASNNQGSYADDMFTIQQHSTPTQPGFFQYRRPSEQQQQQSQLNDGSFYDTRNRFQTPTYEQSQATTTRGFPTIKSEWNPPRTTTTDTTPLRSNTVIDGNNRQQQQHLPPSHQFENRSFSTPSGERSTESFTNSVINNNNILPYQSPLVGGTNNHKNYNVDKRNDYSGTTTSQRRSLPILQTVSTRSGFQSTGNNATNKPSVSAIPSNASMHHPSASMTLEDANQSKPKKTTLLQKKTLVLKPQSTQEELQQQQNTPSYLISERSRNDPPTWSNSEPSSNSSSIDSVKESRNGMVNNRSRQITVDDPLGTNIDGRPPTKALKKLNLFPNKPSKAATLKTYSSSMEVASFPNIQDAPISQPRVEVESNDIQATSSLYMKSDSARTTDLQRSNDQDEPAFDNRIHYVENV